MRRPILSGVVDGLLTDVIRESRGRATRFSVTDVDSVRRCDSEVIAFSQPRERELHDLERFLTGRVYRHERVVREMNKGRECVRALFERFMDCGNDLPEDFRARIERGDRERVVCDYIAGMTDRFARDVWKKGSVPREGT